jgi:1-acyl-sn-glycerol-3-phosphate acyltransferase
VQVPIVPVALDGFERAWGRGRNLRLFQRLTIRIGDPIPPPAGPVSERTYEQLTATLKDRVMQMWLAIRGQSPQNSASRKHSA